MIDLTHRLSVTVTIIQTRRHWSGRHAYVFILSHICVVCRERLKRLDENDTDLKKFKISNSATRRLVDYVIHRLMRLWRLLAPSLEGRFLSAGGETTKVSTPASYHTAQGLLPYINDVSSTKTGAAKALNSGEKKSWRFRLESDGLKQVVVQEDSVPRQLRLVKGFIQHWSCAT